MPAVQDPEQAFRQGLSAYQQRDALQAGEFWEPCALSGHANCQYGLGVLFDSGAGSWPTDSAKAIQWLIQAARQGHVNAQIRLGFLYAIGRDTVAQNIEEAYIWFSLAAARGSDLARSHRDKVEELMTEAELERANRKLVARGIEYRISPPEPSKPFGLEIRPPREILPK